MSYEFLEEDQPEEGLISNIGRQSARTASNLGTLAVGLPGDIFSLVNEYIANPISKGLGGNETPYEETILGKVLPTTQTHRKNIESVTGDYLKPQNEIEKFSDSIIEDAASLISPSKIVQKAVKKTPLLLKNLFKSVGANVAGETVKQNTDSDSSSLATKAGSLFFLSLLDKESAAKQIGKLYQEAENFLPIGATQDASKLNRQLSSLENSITKGRPYGNLSAPESFVIDQSEKIRNLIQNGQISVEQAIAQKRSLHKELGTLYQKVPKFGDQKAVKNLAKKLSNNLNEVIGEYGNKNPKFYGPYKNADQAFGTLAKSNFISHWIDKNIVQHPLTTGLLHVVSPVSTAAAVAAVPYQGAKLLYRITKSPTLAKIYGKTIKAAAKEDKVSFNKYLKQLDDSLQEEESQDRYEFID